MFFDHVQINMPSTVGVTNNTSDRVESGKIRKEGDLHMFTKNLVTKMMMVCRR